MKWSIYIAIALATLMTACSEQETARKVPQGVLDREAFILVLTDVQILDAGYKQKMYKSRDPRDFLNEHYAKIFESHGVDQQTFVASYEWWTESPDDMVGIYEAVIENISAIEARLNVKKEQVTE
jgi:hypothetical protein